MTKRTTVLSVWRTETNLSFSSWYWQKFTICQINFYVNVFRKKRDYFFIFLTLRKIVWVPRLCFAFCYWDRLWSIF